MSEVKLDAEEAQGIRARSLLSPPTSAATSCSAWSAACCG